MALTKPRLKGVQSIDDIVARTRLDSDGCMTWTRCATRDGYGQIWFGNRMRYAHRVAYEMTFGPIPEGKQLDHLCRNRLCCNPAHLEPVSAFANTRRGVNGGSSKEDGSFACRKCGSNDFGMSKSNSAHGGVKKYCIPCHSMRCSRYHRANAERIRHMKRAKNVEQSGSAMEEP